MADEEQTQQVLTPQSPAQEPSDAAPMAESAQEATLSDAVPTTTHQDEVQPQPAEDAAAPADEPTGSIDAAPVTDPDHLTAVVRGEDTAAAARTAAIFDEDDEDDEEIDLPSFRKRQMRDANNANDPDAAIMRKKKKKRQHSPDAAPSPTQDHVELGAEPEQDEDPFANMTEAESKSL